MNWNPHDLERLFKVTPFMPEGPKESALFDYKGGRLCYAINVNVRQKCVLVTAGDPNAFCSDSFYEIAVPCDTITVVPDPYYKNQTGLSFWYGQTGSRRNLTLQILWRPDGDLKVWTVYNFPVDHPLRNVQQDAAATGASRFARKTSPG